MRHTIALAGAFLLSTTAALGQSSRTPLPARDTHEGVTVSADPYADAARSKERFGKKNPYENGILAVEVFLRNDTDRPVQIDLDSIRLLVNPPNADRQRLEPLRPEDVADRTLNKGGGSPNPTARRTPIPGGSRPKAGHSKEWEQMAATLHSLALEADIVAPHATVHGFLFFDLDRHFEWIAHSHLYIPDLKYLDTKQALFFFEIDLAAARPR